MNLGEQQCITRLARLESQGHEPGSREHLSLLGGGTLEVRSGADLSLLHPGETARYAVDVPHAIVNPGRETVTALMVVVHGA